MSLGGRQITEDDIRQYLAMQGNAPAAAPAMSPAMSPYMDPTAMAQQAILARPMRPSFTGQPLLSREVPLGIQGDTGLAYPSMASTGLLNVPSYTSRYAGTDSGGGSGGGGGQATTAGGLDTYGSYNSLSNGLVGALMGNLSSPSYGITVDNMGTYAGQPDYGYGSGMTGIGNPGESYGGPTSSDTGVGNPGESSSVSSENTGGDGGGYGGYGGDSAGSDSFGGGEY
jgi:hypothetical protein